jgi:hypothetical protein
MNEIVEYYLSVRSGMEEEEEEENPDRELIANSLDSKALACGTSSSRYKMEE